MRQDEVLYSVYCFAGPICLFPYMLNCAIGIADRVKNFAVLYVCDLDQVPDFKQMYELYDTVTLMFFFRNKHMASKKSATLPDSIINSLTDV